MEQKENYFVELNRINLNDVKEQKNKLDYISWAWAWQKVKSLHPNMRRTVHENDLGWPYFTDGNTCWVKVTISIDGNEETEYLPIMDYSNRSIPVSKVTSTDVNKAIQRCTVKAIARHGLGLYVYAGEDLPDDPDDKPEDKPEEKAPEKKATPKKSETKKAERKKVEPETQPEPEAQQGPSEGFEPVRLDEFATRHEYVMALRSMGTDLDKVCVAFNVATIDDLPTDKLFEAYARKYNAFMRGAK